MEASNVVVKLLSPAHPGLLETRNLTGCLIVNQFYAASLANREFIPSADIC